MANTSAKNVAPQVQSIEVDVWFSIFAVDGQATASRTAKYGFLPRIGDRLCFDDWAHREGTAVVGVTIPEWPHKPSVEIEPDLEESGHTIDEKMAGWTGSAWDTQVDHRRDIDETPFTLDPVLTVEHLNAAMIREAAESTGVPGAEAVNAVVKVLNWFRIRGAGYTSRGFGGGYVHGVSRGRIYEMLLEEGSPLAVAEFIWNQPWLEKAGSGIRLNYGQLPLLPGMTTETQ